MRKGLLLLQAASLIGRTGGGVEQAESKLRYYWGLAFRIGSGDASAMEEWENGAKMTDEQKKLLDLFNELDEAGALDLTDEELAEMEEMY